MSQIFSLEISFGWYYRWKNSLPFGVGFVVVADDILGLWKGLFMSSSMVWMAFKKISSRGEKMSMSQFSLASRGMW